MAAEYCTEDFIELLIEIKKRDNILRLKRRWLMGLNLSAKMMEKINPLTDKTISEMLLRKDDVYFDIIKSSVQRGFVVNNHVKKDRVKENVQSFDSNNILKNTSSLLDKMTNKGLHCLAELLTDGLFKFEKNRCNMKKVISEHLPTFLNEQNDHFQKRLEQISRLLKDRENFNGNHDILDSPTEYQTAATRVLDRLEDLPVQALRAMHRKLNGDSRHILNLSYHKPQKRSLIGPIRNCCMTMLSELREGEELPEPLVKALAIACLTLKLILGCSSVPKFQKFSPQIESLQHDIATAIDLINSGNILSPSDVEVLYKKTSHLDYVLAFSSKNFRVALSNMLMDFLFECNDMETIPELLLEAVFDIKKRSQNSAHTRGLNDKVEEELELLLGFSAQAKQIVWDLVPGLEVDQDFANAYLEDLVESDDDEEGVDLPRNHELCSDDSNSLSESFGETNPFDSWLPTSTGTRDGISSVLLPEIPLNDKHQSVHITERGTFEPYDFIHCSFPSTINGGESSVPPPGRTKSWHDAENRETMYGTTRNAEVLHCSSPSRETRTFQIKLHSSGNKYLSIQKACDDTSLAMYNIIGGMLDDFAQARHLRLSLTDRAYLRNPASVPNDLKDTCLHLQTARKLRGEFREEEAAGATYKRKKAPLDFGSDFGGLWRDELEREARVPESSLSSSCNSSCFSRSL